MLINYVNLSTSEIKLSRAWKSQGSKDIKWKPLRFAKSGKSFTLEMALPVQRFFSVAKQTKFCVVRVEPVTPIFMYNII